MLGEGEGNNDAENAKDTRIKKVTKVGGGRIEVSSDSASL